MKRINGKSHCPINFSLETFGDSWSLLIIRDIVCYGKQTYGDFLQSKERISTRVLAMRLVHLEKAGILKRQPNVQDQRKSVYTLTPKGQALVPVLIELATWGSTYGPQTAAPAAWQAAISADRKPPTAVAQSARLPFFNNHLARQ